jgi:hypothetical protein
MYCYLSLVLILFLFNNYLTLVIYKYLPCLILVRNQQLNYSVAFKTPFRFQKLKISMLYLS